MLLSSFTHLPRANIGPSVICYMLILKILLIKFGIILKKHLLKYSLLVLQRIFF